jgi:hypothetical protein
MNPLVELLSRFANSGKGARPLIAPSPHNQGQASGRPMDSANYPKRYEGVPKDKMWKHTWAGHLVAEDAHPMDPNPPMQVGPTRTDRSRAHAVESASHAAVNQARANIDAGKALEAVMLGEHKPGKRYSYLNSSLGQVDKELLRDMQSSDPQTRSFGMADAGMAGEVNGQHTVHPETIKAANKLLALHIARENADSVTGPIYRAAAERRRNMRPPTVPMDVPEAVNGRIPIKDMLAKYGGGAMALPIMDIEQILMAAITGTDPIAATLAANPIPAQRELQDFRAKLAYQNANGGY